MATRMRRLIPVLIRWLSDPVIRVTPSDEVNQLRADVERLTAENAHLVVELKRVERLYWQECTENMQLADDNRRLSEENRRLSEEVWKNL